MRFLILTIGFALFTLHSFSQQLIINEISQGTGSQEYVELLVIGTPTCQLPVPCVDLRGYVIDDNDGTFASGSGTGIASGAVRFANDPFWSCIPQGTLIVVYNSNDVNPALPPNDLSTTDGNCTLIIPINSVLFEGQSVSPTSSNPTYPTTGWLAGGAAWNQIAMSNSNDSFQTRLNASAGTFIHAVNWGNNTTNSLIYFPSAGGNVFYMTNTTGINPLLQSNWAQGSVGVNETPGVPNTPENAAFIASMNPECGPGSLVVSASATGTGCGTGCTGTAEVQISGGAGPYNILWSNGATSSTLSNLCAGIYTVDVTDAAGCTMSAQATVSAVNNNLSVTLSPTEASCPGVCDGEIACIPSGSTGPYTFDWNTGATGATISNLCPGTYSVTVTDQDGCTASASEFIGNASNPITLQLTVTDETCDGLCDGEIVAIATGAGGPYTFDWSNGANSSTISDLCDGTYSLTVTNQIGCTATIDGTVQAGVSAQPVNVLTTGPFETSDLPVQFQANVNGGVWSADCGSCISSSGLFDPSSVLPGQYEICYTLGSGNCQSSDCQTISVTQGCITQQTSENVSICPGTGITINGQVLNSSGSYPFNFIDQQGCDSIHTVILSFYSTQPATTFLNLCEGDSALIDGAWYFDSGIVNWTSIDANGCTLQNTTTISLNNCFVEPYSVFIPNTFTPNGDFVNELFSVVITGGLLKSGFILNRWGETMKMFDAQDPTWDGKTQQGLDAPDGVYTYKVIVEKTGGVREEFHGFVTLMR